ncbi:hypothetical protein [Streptomyces sp. 5-10]|uniref:hypothetical protein n=1 Tax=Streptomyces sp. 5-10 TaxID=878925 RepID=UPI00351A5A73
MDELARQQMVTRTHGGAVINAIDVRHGATAQGEGEAGINRALAKVIYSARNPLGSSKDIHRSCQPRVPEPRRRTDPAAGRSAPARGRRPPAGTTGLTGPNRTEPDRTRPYGPGNRA